MMGIQEKKKVFIKGLDNLRHALIVLSKVIKSGLLRAKG